MKPETLKVILAVVGGITGIVLVAVNWLLALKVFLYLCGFGLIALFAAWVLVKVLTGLSFVFSASAKR